MQPVQYKMRPKAQSGNTHMKREWTSLLFKAISLSINCMTHWDCFPKESPQIKPHPEEHSQCSRRASVSTIQLHKLRHRNISYHRDCDTSRLLLENRSLSSKCYFHQTASSGLAACLWHLPCAKVVLHIPEDMLEHHESFCLKQVGPPLSLFSESIELSPSFHWWFQDKSDIMEVTGFITASDRSRTLIWFSSDKIKLEHFSVHPSSKNNHHQSHHITSQQSLHRRVVSLSFLLECIKGISLYVTN